MKKNNISIIIIVILSLIAVSFGLYLIFSNKLKNKQELLNKEQYQEEIRIDASLATQPLTDALIDNLEEFKITHEYTNTDPAYTKLINKEVDEAFVFFTNIKNQVDSLDLEQIQKIYTGEITNWREVGGRDAKIIAYQRPENSGSQTGMLSLVMKDKKMKEPTEKEYIETMMGIIDYVASYENGIDAIGYSYYYYANTMYKNEQMKLLGVNGVKPTNKTIQNGEYPLKSNYYMVTLKDNESATLKKLKEELLSKRGQKIAESAGYVPLGV